MRNYLIGLIIFSTSTIAVAQNGYFFPEGSTFDTTVPEPRDILQYDVGDFHTRYDLLISYMKELSMNSDKVDMKIIGYTNERRPQVVVTITSPENHAKLEEIRTEHLKFTDPSIADPPLDDQPAIILLGYNVHGNEPSSSEAAMLTAYYLTASTSDETSKFLEEAVIMIDPAFNPDGRDRHTTWVNSYHGFPPVADPLDAEHNEMWPRGRTNHYWFDLNRDWLPLAQRESQNRIKFYHQWLPHMVTDFHEMGSNSSYFFEPTEPFGSENPLVPRGNYDRLNNLMADYIERSMNEMKSLYFTREVFDNSYPGYGSTYPDIHGGLGLVFEQASSRGHVQNTDAGQITFPFSIRNHTRSSIAAIRATVENRTEFIEFQSRFFRDALASGTKDPVNGYVFGDAKDRGRTRKFAELLLSHQIEVYQLDRNLTLGGKKFNVGEAFVVPTGQKQYKMVQTMFKPVDQFYDSVFYDASAWTMALGYGLPYEPLSLKTLPNGSRVLHQDLEWKTPEPARAEYSYIMSWDDYYAPKALHHLQQKGIIVRGAFKPFRAKTSDGTSREFGSGTMMINIGEQHLSSEMVFNMVKEVSRKTGIVAHTVSTGRNIAGPDLGSGNNIVLKAPKAIMIVGGSTSSYEAGEVWHLLDERVGLPVTKIRSDQFGRANLNDYNVMILVSGNYSALGENNIKKIREWVRSGGTLIGIRGAVNWLINSKMVDQTMKQTDSEPSGRKSYANMREERGAMAIGGSIYRADVDITHPIGFGLSGTSIPVYRNHRYFLNPSTDPYHSVSVYSKSPHLDGYIHPLNLKHLEGTASMISEPSGGGRYLLFLDNPNFRGYWYGTNKMFLNGIFLREMIR